MQSDILHNAQPKILLSSMIALSVIGSMSLPKAYAETTMVKPVIVVGEKIDKEIKDTNTAITVISGEELESSEENQAKDLATNVPNVITDSFGNISMRGVSGNGAATGGLAFITGARSRISTVVDGSVQDWSGYNFNPTTLWDIKQVEVLRGPQSTTQGASTIGGALVVTTNDPTFENEAAIRTGVEQYENGHLKYNLGVMTSGPLIKDELAYRIALDGDKGEGWLNYDKNGNSTPNLSDAQNINFRGKLLWEPDSIPNLSAKATVNIHRNEGEHASFASNTEDDIASQTMTLGTGTSGAQSRIQDSTADAFAADINYKINSGVTNALHLSRSQSDLSATEYPSNWSYQIKQDINTLENRILFDQPNKKFKGVLGLFLSQKEAELSARSMIFTDYTTTTSALYGEGNYALTQQTKVIFGLRVENEDIQKSGSVFGLSEVEQDTNDTYYLPKIGLNYALSKETSLGVSLSKGYSPSGAGIDVTNNTVYTYESEEVTALELSSKTDFASGSKLYANVFYNDYTDYQAAVGFAVGNVKAAHTYGAEVEATTWLTDNLELFGSVGLLKSEIDKDATYEGNALSGAPETNVALGFTQFIGNQWSFGGDVNYVGEYYSDFANTEAAKAGDHTITNLRAQYTNGDLTVNGYIKNLTDEDAVYFRSGNLATVGQTRTLGISLLYRM